MATSQSTRSGARVAWRDPRVFIGLSLVVASTILGALVLSSGTSQSEYWALTRDVVGGQRVLESDLVAVPVTVEADQAGDLLSASEPLPYPIDSSIFVQDAETGALLRRRDLAATDTGSMAHLPITVAVGSLPDTVRPGRSVDIWTGPGPGQDGQVMGDSLDARRELVEVGVVSVQGPTAGGTRTIVVRVPPDRITGDIVARLAARHVTVVQVP